MIKDCDILEAAILGYQAQISQIERKIAGIKQQLAGTTPAEALPADATVNFRAARCR